MGAELTTQRGEGRTISEAYQSAMSAARDEYGHQEGYSGAINSKGHGYVEVTLPARQTASKLMALLSDYEEIDGLIREAQYEVEYLTSRQRSGEKGLKGQIVKAQREVEKARKATERFTARVERSGYSMYDFTRWFATYNDKWECPLAIMLSPREAKPSKRGRRVWLFIGYAPS